MPNFVSIRQFEQKNDSKNFAGGVEKEKEPLQLLLSVRF